VRPSRSSACRCRRHRRLVRRRPADEVVGVGDSAGAVCAAAAVGGTGGSEAGRGRALPVRAGARQQRARAPGARRRKRINGSAGEVPVAVSLAERGRLRLVHTWAGRLPVQAGIWRSAGRRPCHPSGAAHSAGTAAVAAASPCAGLLQALHRRGRGGSRRGGSLPCAPRPPRWALGAAWGGAGGRRGGLWEGTPLPRLAPRPGTSVIVSRVTRASDGRSSAAAWHA